MACRLTKFISGSTKIRVVDFMKNAILLAIVIATPACSVCRIAERVGAPPQSPPPAPGVDEIGTRRFQWCFVKSNANAMHDNAGDAAKIKSGWDYFYWWQGLMPEGRS